MRSRRKNLQLAGIDVVLPAVVSIEAQEPERPKRMHVIAGFAAEEVDDIIPALVGQWLSHTSAMATLSTTVAALTAMWRRKRFMTSLHQLFRIMRRSSSP